MEAVVLKTRIKNTSGHDMLFRWIAPRGQYLAAGEEVIVDGAYPTAVENRRFSSSCVYDIVHGRVSVVLITNLDIAPVEEEDIRKAVAVEPKPAPVPPAEAEKTELTQQAPVDERWQQGTIEGSKPKPITLPGHEDTLTDAGHLMDPNAQHADGKPQTLEIFKEGTDLGEQKRSEDERVQAEAAEAKQEDAEPSATKKPRRKRTKTTE